LQAVEATRGRSCRLTPWTLRQYGNLRIEGDPVLGLYLIARGAGGCVILLRRNEFNAGSWSWLYVIIPETWVWAVDTSMRAPADCGLIILNYTAMPGIVLRFSDEKFCICDIFLVATLV